MKQNLNQNEVAIIVQDNSKKCLILDARYQKEYEEGHIKNAVNIRNKEQFLNLFANYDGKADFVIIHCEFSSFRGPDLMEMIVKYDQSINLKEPLFPTLTLLNGGYSEFYKSYPGLCEGKYFSEGDFFFSDRELHTKQINERKELVLFVNGEPTTPKMM